MPLPRFRPVHASMTPVPPSTAARRAVLATPLAALLAGALAAAPARAQFARTGAVTQTTCAAGIGLCDANWSLRWYGIGDGTGNTANTLGITGSLANAAIVTSTPSPPWAPNVPGVQQWIGVSADATVSTARGGSGGNDYRYFFQTTFNGGATPQTVDFGIGWDNRLVGAIVGAVNIAADGSYTLGAGAVSLVGGISPSVPFLGGKAGFCRNADGAFPSAQYPNCVYNLAVLAPALRSTTLTFVVQGDGVTDAFFAGAPSGINQPPQPPNVVPEPGTWALVAGGLAALGAAARRGRTA